MDFRIDFDSLKLSLTGTASVSLCGKLSAFWNFRCNFESEPYIWSTSFPQFLSAQTLLHTKHGC